MGRAGKVKVKKTHLESNSWGELKSAPKKTKKIHKTANKIPPEMLQTKIHRIYLK